MLHQKWSVIRKTAEESLWPTVTHIELENEILPEHLIPYNWASAAQYHDLPVRLVRTNIPRKPRKPEKWVHARALLDQLPATLPPNPIIVEYENKRYAVAELTLAEDPDWLDRRKRRAFAGMGNTTHDRRIIIRISLVRAELIDFDR